MDGLIMISSYIRLLDWRFAPEKEEDIIMSLEQNFYLTPQISGGGDIF